MLLDLIWPMLLLAGLEQVRPNGKSGHWSLWGLVVFFGVTYIGNAFGPPPSSV
jgi:hypothetical protein